MITHFATTINRQKTDGESIWTAARHCFERLGLVDCVVYCLDEARKMLVPMADTDLPAAVNRSVAGLSEVPVGTGLAGRVAETGEAMIINRLHPGQRSGERPVDRYSGLAIPIFGTDGLVGVFETEHPEPGFFREWHREVLSVLAGMYGGRMPRQSPAKKSYTADHPKYRALLTLLTEEEIFRDPTLSLSALAERLDIGTTLLSNLINEAGGTKFNDFINGFRVNAALDHFRDPEYGHYDTVSVGLEAGFNSKSTFYTAFRKVTGYTPAKYLRMAA